MLAAVALALSGCALQPAYETPDLLIPLSWSVQSSGPQAAADAWWRALNDNAINTLANAAFADSPTLAQAVARLDEARAIVGVNRAAQGPSAGASANVSRARSQNVTNQGGSAATLGTSASYGPNFNWELDLFGRVRQSVEAARNRLDARTADAASARLALAADVADGVLSLRACENARRILADDIASREKTLELTRMRLKTGFAAPVDEARAMAGIASSGTSLAAQDEQCARQVNALVALSGQSPTAVRQLLGTGGLPQAPAAAPALPAEVLTGHPAVKSAEREVAAAWAEIGVARADRLPRLDLAAALTGQWIRAGGSTLDFTTWSIGPSVSGTLFDGGAGAANVGAAQARYRRAVASLQGTLRSTVQDVENALAAQASAKARVVSAGESVAAARTALQATESQWKAGATSMFELEDSRRQFASAQDAEVSARRDQTQAWVALVKATGGAITLSPESLDHE